LTVTQGTLALATRVSTYSVPPHRGAQNSRHRLAALGRRFYWRSMTPSVIVCPSQGLGFPTGILPVGWIELL